MAANKIRASVTDDAGPLIYLDEVGCLDLLADFEQVLAPDVVWDEITRHRPGALQRSDLKVTRMAKPYQVRQVLRAIERLEADCDSSE